MLAGRKRQPRSGALGAANNYHYYLPGADQDEDIYIYIYIYTYNNNNSKNNNKMRTHNNDDNNNNHKAACILGLTGRQSAALPGLQ